MKTHEKMIITAINHTFGRKDVLLPKYEEGLFSAAIKLSEDQDLLPIFGNAVFDSEMAMPPEIFDRLLSSLATSISRYENQMLCLNEVCGLLEKNGINYITMKGTELRRYYPKPELRTCSDVDILIDEKDMAESKSLLIGELGYKAKPALTHDISFFTPAGVHFELHYRLFEETVGNDWGFFNPWENAVPVDGYMCRHVMSPDDAYIYTVLHMLKHFTVSSAGIRNVLDIFLLRQNTELNEEYISDVCQKAAAEKFRKAVERLADIWFAGAAETDFDKQLGEYIIRNGIYGTAFSKMNLVKIKNAEKDKKRRGTVWFLIAGFFSPYSKMKEFYKPVKNCPPLIVIFWFVRAYSILTKKNRIRDRVAVNSNLDKMELDSMEKMLHELDVNIEKTAP